jgi:hypothetical protein
MNNCKLKTTYKNVLLNNICKKDMADDKITKNILLNNNHKRNMSYDEVKDIYDEIKNIYQQIEHIEDKIYQNTIYNINLILLIFDNNIDLLKSNKINYYLVNYIKNIYRKEVKNVLFNECDTNLEILLLKNNIKISNIKNICVDELTKFYNKAIVPYLLKFINKLKPIFNLDKDNLQNINLNFNNNIEITIIMLCYVRYLNLSPENVIDIFFEKIEKINKKNESDNLITIIDYGIRSFISYMTKINYEFSYEDKRFKRYIKYEFCDEKNFKKVIGSNNIMEEFECPICFNSEKITNVIYTNCGHMICTNCTEKILETLQPYKNLSCALCRQNIKNINFNCSDMCKYFEKKLNKNEYYF